MFQSLQIPFLSYHIEQYNNALHYPTENTFMGMLQSPFLPHLVSTDYRYFNSVNSWSQQPFLPDQNHMSASLPPINAPSSSLPPIPGNLFSNASRISLTEKFDLKKSSIEAENNTLDSQTVNRLKREFSYINTDGFRPDDVECLSFSSLLKPTQHSFDTSLISEDSDVYEQKVHKQKNTKISCGSSHRQQQEAEKYDAVNERFSLENKINMTTKVKNCPGVILSKTGSISPAYDPDSTTNLVDDNSGKLQERKRKKILPCSKKKVKNVKTELTTESNTFEKYYENNEFYGYTQYLRKLSSLVTDVNFDDKLSQLFYNQLSRPFEDICAQSLTHCQRNSNCITLCQHHIESKKMQSVYEDCNLSMQHDQFPFQVLFDQSVEYSNPILMKYLRLSLE